MILIEPRGARAGAFFVPVLEHDSEEDGSEVNAASSVRFPRDAVKPCLDYRSERAEAEGRADPPAEAEVVSRSSVGGVGLDVVGSRSGHQVWLGRASGGRDDKIGSYSPYSQVGILDFRRASRWSREPAGKGLIHPIEPQPDRQLADSCAKKAGDGLAFRVRISEPARGKSRAGGDPHRVAPLGDGCSGKQGRAE